MTFKLGRLSVLLATALAAAEKACERVEPRLDRQVETMCMVWKQRGGRPDLRAPRLASHPRVGGQLT